MVGDIADAVSVAPAEPHTQQDFPGWPEPRWPKLAALGLIVGILASTVLGSFALWWAVVGLGLWGMWRARRAGKWPWFQVWGVVAVV
ncbi:hypothetical protein HNQ40_000542 [Algisphaera agarilytica]|uniref:Uncharacterized protein n=1 Tax=Algisphaera agarilytica TaxID=1385975 RepID=A0A7X0H5Z7_9BACT|nr:hypothetical protein [Algisphaera agarilytica]